MSYYYLVMLLQALCIGHIMVTRADSRWFYIVFFAPGVGAAVYLAVEVLPRLRQREGLSVALPFFARRRIAKLEKQLRFSDTVDHRTALAEAYSEAGRFADAVAIYKPALDGVLRNNLHLLHGIAKAYFANGDYAEAAAALGRIGASSERLKERTLLLAMILEKQGDFAEAEAHFQAAAKGFIGEEARCRLGLFLWQRDRRNESRELFCALLEYADISDRDYRRRERQWIRIAKEKIKVGAAEAASPAAAQKG